MQRSRGSRACQLSCRHVPSTGVGDHPITHLKADLTREGASDFEKFKYIP